MTGSQSRRPQGYTQGFARSVAADVGDGVTTAARAKRRPQPAWLRLKVFAPSDEQRLEIRLGSGRPTVPQEGSGPLAR
ncbi:hypothetical protein [Streptomyces sp. NPDC056480]|uniref:hypothetical protein n=1 Tax=Streptomyces sp. NPDC056480 TaxID=3345833 RepID=UPI003693FB98